MFYVAPESVYVWASTWDNENEKEHIRSILFRMPLDGADPTALRVSGSPVDQFSFLDDPQGHATIVGSGKIFDGLGMEMDIYEDFINPGGFAVFQPDV